jgi:hypothetical protein
MMLLHRRDLAALGASGLSCSTITAETISADEPSAPKSERGRMNLAAGAAQEGDGGEKVASRHQVSAISSA